MEASIMPKGETSMDRKIRMGVLIATIALAPAFMGAAKDAPARAKAPAINASIGVISILTGQGSGYGESITNGLKLAGNEINAKGEVKIELVQPTDDTTGVARFLETKGEGFHHVCFEVANLAESLLRLEIDGIQLIDTAPRKGAEGPVAFLHPKSCHGVLVELIEAPGGPAWRSLGYPR